MHFLTWLAFLNPAQIETLKAVFLSAFLKQNRLSQEELLSYFNQKIVPRFNAEDLVVIASEDNHSVGFAIFQVWDIKTYYLAEMAVAPSQQRQGVGKKLVFSIFEKIPTAGKILLVTEEKNLQSQLFYEALGFRRSPFQHPDYPKGFIGYEYLKPAEQSEIQADRSHGPPTLPATPQSREQRQSCGDQCDTK